MNTSKKVVNKRAADPFDRLIFEKGLRITQVVVEKKLDILLVILNNSRVLKIRLSDYDKLKKASQTKLNSWKLISNGVGIEWKELDEDLSLKGIIKTAAMNAALQSLEGKGEYSFVA